MSEKIVHNSPEVQYPVEKKEQKTDQDIGHITHIETEDGFRKDQYVSCPW